MTLIRVGLMMRALLQTLLADARAVGTVLTISVDPRDGKVKRGLDVTAVAGWVLAAVAIRSAASAGATTSLAGARVILLAGLVLNSIGSARAIRQARARTARSLAIGLLAIGDALSALYLAALRRS